jgi:hypothetical protein
MSTSPSFAFSFNVPKTFLTEPGHPITVPKEQVDYHALETAGLDHAHLRLIFPQGEQNTEQFYTLYRGQTEQRGPYIQLQMRGRERALPAYLKLKDRLVVLVYRYGRRSFVVLEYRDSPP